MLPTAGKRDTVTAAWSGTDWETPTCRVGQFARSAKCKKTGFEVYCGHERPAPFFFLGAIPAALWRGLGGYNEALPRAADADFGARAVAAGIRLHGLGGVIALHLNHPRR